MHKVFVSYHHANDQWYREALVAMATGHVFLDRSVHSGDIDEHLPDQRIREIIRDRHLRDSTVTIVLVPWDRVYSNPGNLSWLVDATFRDRAKCEYDLSRPMRRANS